MQSKSSFCSRDIFHLQYLESSSFHHSLFFAIFILFYFVHDDEKLYFAIFPHEKSLMVFFDANGIYIEIFQLIITLLGHKHRILLTPFKMIRLKLVGFFFFAVSSFISLCRSFSAETFKWSPSCVCVFFLLVLSMIQILISLLLFCFVFFRLFFDWINDVFLLLFSFIFARALFFHWETPSFPFF